MTQAAQDARLQELTRKTDSDISKAIEALREDLRRWTCSSSGRATLVPTRTAPVRFDVSPSSKNALPGPR